MNIKYSHSPKYYEFQNQSLKMYLFTYKMLQE